MFLLLVPCLLSQFGINGCYFSREIIRRLMNRFIYGVKWSVMICNYVNHKRLAKTELFQISWLEILKKSLNMVCGFMRWQRKIYYLDRDKIIIFMANYSPNKTLLMIRVISKWPPSIDLTKYIKIDLTTMNIRWKFCLIASRNFSAV